MGNAIDAAICLDSTSLMTLNFSSMKGMILRVLDNVMVDDGESARLALVKFRSPSDHPVTFTSGFMPSRNKFEQTLDVHQPQTNRVDGDRAVGEALHEVLNLPWRDNDDNDMPVEKLAVLVTDGVPCGLYGSHIDMDVWKMSNRLREESITLVVIGVGESIVECDDFYCALAQNTGGVYIPFVNAAHVLSSVITSMLDEQLSFHQSIRGDVLDVIEENSSFRYSYMKSRVHGMINECQTINDVRSLFYHHRLLDQHNDQ